MIQPVRMPPPPSSMSAPAQNIAPAEAKKSISNINR
jgi:hypothetical protein